MKPIKMYVLVRKDLNPIYAGVQAGHAVAQFALEHEDIFKVWGNKTIVYLGVPNEYVLSLLETKIKDSGKTYSKFIEPDLHNAITAIACVDTGEIFKSLRVA